MTQGTPDVTVGSATGTPDAVVDALSTTGGSGSGLTGAQHDARDHTGVTGVGTDATAVHSDGTGEIAALTEKASPVSADLLIIEDSAASNAKKKVQIGNLPASGSSNSLDASVDDNVVLWAVGSDLRVPNGVAAHRWHTRRGDDLYAITGAVTTDSDDVSFQGDRMTREGLATTSAIVDDAFAIFVVVRGPATAVNTINEVLLCQNDGVTTDNGRWSLRRAGAETGQQYVSFFYAVPTSNVITTTTAVFDDTNHLVSVRGDGSGTQRIYVDDGAVEDTDSSTPWTPSQELMVAATTNDANAYVGKIGEIIIINRALTDEEFATVKASINSRHSIW